MLAYSRNLSFWRKVNPRLHNNNYLTIIIYQKLYFIKIIFLSNKFKDYWTQLRYWKWNPLTKCISRSSINLVILKLSIDTICYLIHKKTMTRHRNLCNLSFCFEGVRLRFCWVTCSLSYFIDFTFRNIRAAPDMR